MIGLAVASLGLLIQGWLLCYLLTNMRAKALRRRNQSEDVFLRALVRRNLRAAAIFYLTSWDYVKKQKPLDGLPNYDIACDGAAASSS